MENGENSAVCPCSVFRPLVTQPCRAVAGFARRFPCWPSAWALTGTRSTARHREQPPGYCPTTSSLFSFPFFPFPCRPGGGASPSDGRNWSGRCFTLIPGIAAASGGGGSHGVHSLHRDPRSALGLQEVCGALPLPGDCTLHQAPLAQKGCAGGSRHQAGARRQRWGCSGTCSRQKRPGGCIWKP